MGFPFKGLRQKLKESGREIRLGVSYFELNKAKKQLAERRHYGLNFCELLGLKNGNRSQRRGQRERGGAERGGREGDMQR